METERSDETSDRNWIPSRLLGWRTSFLLGLVTLLLGVVIIARPTLSLIAIAVLLGIVMIVSGIYHIARALDGRENERVWRGIAGALALLAGLVLLRHLHLSLALIGLFIGITWVIQGVSALMESFSRTRRRAERGWSVFFGVISVIAGIVVISAPIASVATLTIFMGAWFIVIGALEMIGSLLSRRAAGREPAGQVSVPGQRASTTAAGPGQDTVGEHADQPGEHADAGPEPKRRNVPH